MSDFTIVREIPSAPGYAATSAGEIVTMATGHIHRQHKAKRGGYRSVGLWINNGVQVRTVHRLVCEAFHGVAPDGKNDAAHGDGDRANNRPENLRWCSRRENERDKELHGTRLRGSRVGGAILTESQVVQVRRRYAALPKGPGGTYVKKGSLAALAAEYGVTASCVYHIAARLHWRHVP